MAPDHSLLRILQTGIPETAIADQYFIACEKGWIGVLEHIKKNCEQKISKQKYFEKSVNNYANQLVYKVKYQNS